jgi:hypothetical protein
MYILSPHMHIPVTLDLWVIPHLGSSLLFTYCIIGDCKIYLHNTSTVYTMYSMK